MRDLTWDEFEQRLTEAGWGKTAAKRERQSQEHGVLGDIDGDLEEIEGIVRARSATPKIGGRRTD